MKTVSLDCPANLPNDLGAIDTPAFVYDERVINRLLDHTGPLRGG